MIRFSLIGETGQLQVKQGNYRTIFNRRIADQYFQMRLEGDCSAFSRGGQFVDIAIDGFFLRRPLAVREWDSCSFDVIYKTVGKGTEALSLITPGTVLNVLTGLGNGFDPYSCKDAALLISGGLGVSPLFSLAKELVRTGKKVSLIAGFNKASEIILENEYRELGVNLHIVTMDGSAGTRGLVTDAIAALKPEFDYFYTCGPKLMMKAVCTSLTVPGEASLEERMGCGCGICYGCTCHTVKGPARVCADGPVFKKEDIIW